MRVAYRVRVEGTGLLAGVASPKQAVIPDETFFIRGQPAFFLGEGGQATVFVRRGAGEAVPGTGRRAGTAMRAGGEGSRRDGPGRVCDDRPDKHVRTIPGLSLIHI